MFAPKKNTYVDDVIARLTVKMHNDMEAGSEEFGVALDQLSKLQKIRQEEKPDTVSSDALLAAAVNILGIALIIKHEHVNVITSKALGFIPKLKP
jgi:hypothetical protein